MRSDRLTRLKTRKKPKTTREAVKLSAGDTKCNSWLQQHKATLEPAVSAAVAGAMSTNGPLLEAFISALVMHDQTVQDEKSRSLAPTTAPSREDSRVNLLVTMDPGQDLDDEMFIVLAAALEARGLIRLLGVVTCLAPAGMRARLARGTMDQLGLGAVPVAAGSDGGAAGDPESIANMASVDYITRLPPQEDVGGELMCNVLRESGPKSVTIAIIASLKDMADLLRQHEALVIDKVKEIVIMGGVEAFGKGPDEMLVPDTAHNNNFDRDASCFVYRRCQEVGIPLRVVTRFAAYACQMSRSIYDEMAATGSAIGDHLKRAQKQSIEKLWQRVCAPEGSQTRQGLPMRCDKPWFCATFCNGRGAERSADEGIWDEVLGFNMYDPLALVLAVPALNDHFDPEELIVNGVTHRVVGTSKESTGVKDGDRLRAWLYSAFLEGIKLEGLQGQNIAYTGLVAAQRKEIAALKAELDAEKAKAKQPQELEA